MHHTDKDEGLVALGTLKRFRVAKGEPDIRGWEVVTSDHKKIGEVHELIIDKSAMKVRYLDIAIGRKILGTKDSSHVLLPIAGATLDDDDNRVYLTDVSAAALSSIPPYDHRVITREFESTLTRFYDAAVPATQGSTDRNFYDREAFDEKRFWAKRRAGRDDGAYVTPADELTDRERLSRDEEQTAKEQEQPRAGERDRERIR